MPTAWKLPTAIGLVVLLTCCSSQDALELDCSLHYSMLGAWVLRSDDGRVFEPNGLEPDYRKEGLRVRATLKVRQDMGSVTMLGPRVDVLGFALLPCDWNPCGAVFPPVHLVVLGPDQATVSGATLSNVVGPAGGGEVPVSCGFAPYPDDLQHAGVVCAMHGSAAGVYEADLTAPGLQSFHVRAEVEAREPLPNECCPIQYVTRFEAIVLH